MWHYAVFRKSCSSPPTSSLITPLKDEKLLTRLKWAQDTHWAVFSQMNRVAILMGFPGGTSIKNLPANAGDVRDLGSIPGSGRAPGKGHGDSLQYSCLENSMDRGAWWALVHRVSKCWTWLKYGCWIKIRQCLFCICWVHYIIFYWLKWLVLMRCWTISA